jgi:hypothetical protein
MLSFAHTHSLTAHAMFAIRHVYRVRGHSAIGCLTARGFATETLRQQTTPFGFAFDIDGVLIKVSR